VFKTGRHLFQSWTRFIEPTPSSSSSWRAILKMSSHRRVLLSSGLFPSDFPIKNPIYVSVLPHMFHSACQSHTSDLINLIIFGDQYKSWWFSLSRLLHPPVTSTLLGPNTFLGTLFSNTLSLCSLLNMRMWYQVLHPCKTGRKLQRLWTETSSTSTIGFCAVRECFSLYRDSSRSSAGRSIAVTARICYSSLSFGQMNPVPTEVL